MTQLLEIKHCCVKCSLEQTGIVLHPDGQVTSELGHFEEVHSGLPNHFFHVHVLGELLLRGLLLDGNGVSVLIKLFFILSLFDEFIVNKNIKR